MSINRTAIVGAGAAVIGLLIGLAIGTSGRSDLEARLGQQDALHEGVAAVSESVAAIEARVGALEERLGQVSQEVAARAEEHSGALAGLAERIEGVGSTLTGAVSGVGSSVSEALSTELADLRARLAAVTAPAEGEAGAVGGGEAAGAPQAGEGETLRIGQTVAFGDGAARVFLSAVDAAAGTARVAINGSATSTLALGEPTAAGPCEVTLTGFVPGGVTISGSCGEGAAEEAGATEEAEAGAAEEAEAGSAEAAAAAPEGTGTPVAIGGTVSFADGALRVFLSAFDESSGTAWVAVNGTKLTELRLGEPVDAGNCKLRLTGFGDEEATFDAAC